MNAEPHRKLNRFFSRVSAFRICSHELQRNGSLEFSMFWKMHVLKNEACAQTDNGASTHVMASLFSRLVVALVQGLAQFATKRSTRPPMAGVCIQFNGVSFELLQWLPRTGQWLCTARGRLRMCFALRCPPGEENHHGTPRSHDTCLCRSSPRNCFKAVHIQRVQQKKHICIMNLHPRLPDSAPFPTSYIALVSHATGCQLIGHIILC